MQRNRRLRWLCALIWAPLAVLAVSASSFSALRCTVSGLFIPETCCPMAGEAPAPDPTPQAALQPPGCCERVVVSNRKAPAARAASPELVTPDVAPSLAALIAPPAPPPARPSAPTGRSVHPPGRSAPAFLLTHAFLI